MHNQRSGKFDVIILQYMNITKFIKKREKINKNRELICVYLHIAERTAKKRQI